MVEKQLRLATWLLASELKNHAKLKLKLTTED